MVWKLDDPQGNEAGKVKYDIVRYTTGIGFDVGCGPNKAFAHFIGVDNKKDTALFGIDMKPDLVVEDATKLSLAVQPESADFIFSSHMLEHVEDHAAALEDWWSCLKVGGYLILYLPHRDLYPRIGQPGANPDHKHDFVADDIIHALQQHVCTDYGRYGFEIVVNEVRSEGTEYSFLLVIRKDPEWRTTEVRQRPAKTACVVRHGGFGDQIQAACLFPELKRQGYHITVLTTTKGRSVLEHDPHVDDWFIVGKGQVPDAELGAFWRALAKRYDKFVNLNESVERTFLALPGTIPHGWPHALRHKMLNHNYGEHAAALAEIPFVPEGRFYASAEETAWCDEYLAPLAYALEPGLTIGMRSDPVYVVMWVLAGSSPHKWSPHMDTVIHLILKRLRRAVVILTGDAACAILEQGWEENPRVKCESGKLDIRKTMALANRCQLVVGPETGVMNAVAFNPDVSKVLMLSHSSVENLSKHWFETVSVAGTAGCYPCHQLHFTTEYCPREQHTQAAICQAMLPALSLYQPIEDAYTCWAKVQLLRAA